MSTSPAVAMIGHDGFPAERLEVFSLPMNVRFRRVQHRAGVLIWGAAGVGEFSPFEEYDDDESASWLAAALEAAHGPAPRMRRRAVAVNCTIPAVGPDAATALVVAGHGCRTAKVKVAEPGQALGDDLARVAAVRAALGPDGRMRVDANGGWTVEKAVEAITRLAEFDLEYAEQPVATVSELTEVRRRVHVPIAADESIRRSGDPMRVKLLGAADIAVLKVQPLGGVQACLAFAEEIAMPVVVSSALESSIGIAAGVALAAALPDQPYAAGLGTASMLTTDLTTEPLLPVAGELAVRQVVPDEALLEAARPDEDVVRYWLDRLARCHAILQGRRP
jgi:O-succinylbenzoate synthase